MASSFDPADLPEHVRQFLTDRHLATLTLQRSDGRPHVTPVGFSFEPERTLARVITWADSWKYRHVARQPGQPVAICQVDGGQWLTLYGTAVATDDAERAAEGVRRYAERYRSPKDRPDRVVIEVTVTEIVGTVRAPS